MLKKTTWMLLGLACSSISFAGTMGPVCKPGDVTVPCVANKWDFGVQALYLRPLYSNDLGYAPSTIETAFNELRPDWDWGYRLEGSYHFNTGNDITLTWSHYDAENYAGTFSGLYLLSSTPIAAAYALDIENKYDQVNLVMGQYTDASILTNARFYGGLQYANMRVDRTHHYTVIPQVASSVGGNVRDLDNTDFNGVGPVIGIDYAYDLSRNFSLTANTAGSLLYGTSRLNYSTAYGNGFVAATLYGSHKAVVPSLEAKLGANYAYDMVNGQLNLQGGYQVVNYFNALQNSNFAGTLTTSHFGMYGPYMGVRWLAAA